jgi:teichuronic acid biosynthesis glycosyltransferase TuaG
MSYTNPVFSIITPLYNCEDYLRATIDSVRSQSFQNWELIIIDDCSTDKSFFLAKSYSELDPRIIVLKNEKNSGQAFCRNVGLRNARGKYLAFLDSDDLWMDKKLDRYFKEFQENNVSFIYSSYKLIDEHGVELKKVLIPPSVLDFKTFMAHNPVGCLTVAYEINSFRNIYFVEDRKYQSIEDNIHWANIFSRNDVRYKRIEEVLSSYRIRSNSSSSKKIDMIKKRYRMLRIYYENSIIKTIGFMVRYAMKVLTK